jgi:magnesium transporter
MGLLHVRDDYIITICSKPVAVLERFRNGQIKGLFTFKKTRFIFQVLYHVAKDFLKYLKHIDKKTDDIENKLHKSMKNRELYRLMELGKSLVYFTTSLKSNEAMMERVLRGRIVKMYEEDQELLEDAIVEIKQAIEMANIYSSILNGTMDAYASIISNNLNVVMKFLASVTIVLSIPTVIFSYFGQNVLFPYGNNPFMWVYILIGSVIICTGAVLLLYRKDMF